MGKFSRFALAGGLVHQAITVPTHSTMNTHVSLPFDMLSLLLDNIYTALMHSIYQVVQLFRRNGVPGFFQTAFYGNDTPFEMYSELKVSESTGDFRRSYE